MKDEQDRDRERKGQELPVRSQSGWSFEDLNIVCKGGSLAAVRHDKVHFPISSLTKFIVLQYRSLLRACACVASACNVVPVSFSSATKTRASRTGCDGSFDFTRKLRSTGPIRSGRSVVNAVTVIRPVVRCHKTDPPSARHADGECEGDRYDD